MTNHIDPDKVRELAKLHRKWGEEVAWAPKIKNTHTQIAEILESLLPTSSRPTLDDLIEQGHDPRQYVGMQCEVEGEVNTMILLARDGLGGDSWLLASKLGYSWKMPRTITPLPDLPRLVWPAEFNPETDEEVPNGSTEPQVGEAWLVSTREGEQREALKAGNRWCVKDGDDVEEWVEEALIPIARLVPEVDPKVLLTEEDYRNTPRDTVVKDTTYPSSDVWDKWYENEWRTATRRGSSKSHTNAEMADTGREVIWAPEVRE